MRLGDPARLGSPTRGRLARSRKSGELRPRPRSVFVMMRRARIHDADEPATRARARRRLRCSPADKTVCGALRSPITIGTPASRAAATETNVRSDEEADEQRRAARASRRARARGHARSEAHRRKRRLCRERIDDRHAGRRRMIAARSANRISVDSKRLSIERVDDRQHRSFGPAADELGQHEPDSDGLSRLQVCLLG